MNSFTVFLDLPQITRIGSWRCWIYTDCDANIIVNLAGIFTWRWCCDEGRVSRREGESRREGGRVQKKLPMGLDSFLSLLLVWF